VKTNSFNKMKFFYTLCFLFSFSTFYLFGQHQRIDSLSAIVNLQKMDTVYFSSLTRLGIEYERFDSKKAVYYFRKGIQESGKNHHRWTALSALRLAGVYSAMGKNDSTDYFFKISSDFVNSHPKEVLVKRDYLTALGIHQKRIGNYWEALQQYDEISKLDVNIIGSQNLAGNYLNISNVYQSLGLLDESIDATFKSLTIFEELQNNMGLSFCYNSLGNLYYHQKDYPKAESWYLKSIALRKITEDHRGQAIVMNNLGNLMMDTERYENALHFFNKAKSINASFDIKDQVITNLVNIGMTYEKKGQNDLAFAAFSEAYHLATAISNLPLETIILTHIGTIYSKKGENQKAESTLKEVLQRTTPDKDLEGAQRIYGALYRHFEKTKQFEDAFYFKNLYHQVKDSIENVGLKLKINNLESRYAFVKKEQENELLTIENALIHQQKSNQLKIFLLGLIFLISLGTLLYYQNRHRKKANTQLTLLNSELDLSNQVKTRFFSILNHDLRSPVANLITLLHLKNECPDELDEATKSRMDAKTIHTAEHLLQHMEDILLWSKGQMAHFAPQFKKVAVQTLFLNNQKAFAGFDQVAIDYECAANFELLTDENYLNTIIRNFTSNALHAVVDTPSPKILWRAWQKGSIQYLSITDNGNGVSKESVEALFNEHHIGGIQSGLGLHLIRDLAKPIHCTIEIDLQPVQGTTFILKFQDSGIK
jgi:tetratricopeptide (TPR) repeat protein